MGYAAFFSAEHHFHPFGVVPNPTALLCAIARRTTRIRLGTAISILTFQNPRTAAEITGKTRYAGNASLGRCHGAGVRLSRPFLGKPKSAIRQTIYRILSEPIQPNVNQAYSQNCSPR